MADELAYSRKWKEFGRWPQFEDTETKMVGSVAPDNTSDIFIRRDPNKLILTNVAPKSQHGVSYNIISLIYHLILNFRYALIEFLQAIRV